MYECVTCKFYLFYRFTIMISPLFSSQLHNEQEEIFIEVMTFYHIMSCQRCKSNLLVNLPSSRFGTSLISKRPLYNYCISVSFCLDIFLWLNMNTPLRLYDICLLVAQSAKTVDLHVCVCVGDPFLKCQEQNIEILIIRRADLISQYRQRQFIYIM